MHVSLMIQRRFRRPWAIPPRRTVIAVVNRDRPAVPGERIKPYYGGSKERNAKPHRLAGRRPKLPVPRHTLLHRIIFYGRISELGRERPTRFAPIALL